MNMLTQERLKELLSYDPETGQFVWRVHRQCIRAGSVAGFDHRVTSSDDLVYRRVTVDGRQYYAHRLAWLYVHGSWPKEDVDHINGDGRDNRIANLREATVSQNLGNMTKRKPSSAGVRGVVLRGGKYRARVRVNRKLINLGSFSALADADRAAREARLKYFGEFAK